MARKISFDLEGLSKKEIAEIEKLRSSEEVKTARKAQRAKQYLYSLRCLYNQGKKILEEKGGGEDD